jgi:hypothetical protein
MNRFWIWLFEKILQDEEVKTYVIEKYRTIASDRLDIKTEIRTVKKGSKKYDVVFFENRSGKVMVDVNRHTDI